MLTSFAQTSNEISQNPGQKCWENALKNRNCEILGRAEHKCNPLHTAVCVMECRACSVLLFDGLVTSNARLRVLTVMKIQVMTFWVVTVCSDVVG